MNWTVKPTGSPKLNKRCARCGCSHFISSNRFRVNANGSRIDVWLIWKCEHCKATWNMEILSRVKAGGIDKELYRRFLGNDEALALHYVLNKKTLGQNGVKVDSDTLVWEVDGEVALIGCPAQITISTVVSRPVKACKVIARKLGISSGAVRRLAEDGLLVSNSDVFKGRLHSAVSFFLRAGWGEPLTPELPPKMNVLP